MMMFSFMLSKVLASLRSQRGVVSTEWIILAIVIMLAITVAFAPTFQTALQAGVQQVQQTLTTQSGS